MKSQETDVDSFRLDVDKYAAEELRGNAVVAGRTGLNSCEYSVGNLTH
jgi:hypothetical protein